MTKNIRNINPTEHQIQSAIVEWANKTNIPNKEWYSYFMDYKIGDFLVKNSNEGKRTFYTGKNMRLEGLTAGFPDMTLYLPRFSLNGCSTYISKCALLIEVKSKKGIISNNQKKIIIRYSEMPYPISIVYSVEEGIQAIKDYLGMK